MVTLCVSFRNDYNSICKARFCSNNCDLLATYSSYRTLTVSISSVYSSYPSDIPTDLSYEFKMESLMHSFEFSYFGFLALVLRPAKATFRLLYSRLRDSIDARSCA
jgi:hypothetical protein